MLPGMLTPLTSTQTLDRARAALQSGRGAGLPELLKLIETLSTNHAKITIDELSALIEKDAAVLTRVLTVANTVAHNPGFTPMASVAHAIHQIGFTRVRSLAVSLMLVENAGNRNPPEQREAAAQALCAGLLAQGCAQSLGSVDADLAFACAALRQFGQILLPAVSVELYREATKRFKTQAEDAAYRTLFGLTPLELSRKLLGPARLPEEVTRSLRDCHPESMGGAAASTLDARLLGIADFGGKLARITLDSASNADVFAQRTGKLAERYEKLLPGAADLIAAALQHTDDRMASFTRGSKASLPTASLERIKARVRRESPAGATIGENLSTSDARFADDLTAPVGADPTTAETEPVVVESPAVDPTPAAPAALAAATPAPVAEEAAAADSWADQLAQSKAFETQPSAEVAPRAADPWSAPLKMVRDNFGAHECWVFLPQPGGESLPLAHGSGDRWHQFKTRAALRRDERTVFGVCLTRRENVVIHDTTEATLAAYLPEWFRQVGNAPGAFLLMPLHEDQKSHGLVLIGWKKPQRIAVAAAQIETARQLFASVSAAQRGVVV